MFVIYGRGGVFCGNKEVKQRNFAKIEIEIFARILVKNITRFKEKISNLDWDSKQFKNKKKNLK